MGREGPKIEAPKIKSYITPFGQKKIKLHNIQFYRSSSSCTRDLKLSYCLGFIINLKDTY